MEETIAAKLHYMQQHSNDPIRLVLDTMSVIQNTKSNIEMVISVYEKILAGKIKVVETISALELKPEDKKTIETRLTEKYKGSKLVFLYLVDETFPRGIQIRVGDDMINVGLTTKYF